MLKVVPWSIAIAVVGVCLFSLTARAAPFCKKTCLPSQYKAPDGCCHFKCPQPFIPVATGERFCCAPGQRWTGRMCGGTPEVCPDGFVPNARQQACVLKTCARGQIRATDGVHCCWDGQGWDKVNLTCTGNPRCPAGTWVNGMDCSSDPVVGCRAGDRKSCQELQAKKKAEEAEERRQQAEKAKRRAAEQMASNVEDYTYDRWDVHPGNASYWVLTPYTMHHVSFIVEEEEHHSVTNLIGVGLFGNPGGRSKWRHFSIDGGVAWTGLARVHTGQTGTNWGMILPGFEINFGIWAFTRVPLGFVIGLRGQHVLLGPGAVDGDAPNSDYADYMGHHLSGAVSANLVFDSKGYYRKASVEFMVGAEYIGYYYKIRENDWDWNCYWQENYGGQFMGGMRLNLVIPVNASRCDREEYGWKDCWDMVLGAGIYGNAAGSLDIPFTLHFRTR